MNKYCTLNLKIYPLIIFILSTMLLASCKFNPKIITDNEEDILTEEPDQTVGQGDSPADLPTGNPTETPTSNPHSNPNDPEVMVDPELVDYLEEFKIEGEKRGWTIDISKMSATFIEPSNSSYTGLCSFNGRNFNRIVIDKNIWNTLNPFMKELVMFHELGHCVLERSHREVTFTDGTCGSIMRSGLGTCIDNYNTNTRISYLNELYDPQMSFVGE